MASNKVKSLTIKDIHFLKSAIKLGFITKDMLPYFNISKGRFYQYLNSGYIDKKGAYLLYGTMTTIYKLNPKITQKIKSEYGLYQYKSNDSQLEHDYCLSKIYCFLSISERESWINETELQIRYPNVPKTVDAIYLDSESNKIGVEIITDKYTKEDIKYKTNFIRHYCDNYIILHTTKDRKYDI